MTTLKLLASLACALAISSLIGCADGDDVDDVPTNVFGVTIEMHDFVFVPDERSILSNQDERIDVENKGSVAHTFTVDELGIDVGLEPGESAPVVFEENGDWPFYCRFHGDQGMTGVFHAAIQRADR